MQSRAPRQLGELVDQFLHSGGVVVLHRIVLMFFEEFSGQTLKWLAGRAQFVAVMIALIRWALAFCGEVYLAKPINGTIQARQFADDKPASSGAGCLILNVPENFRDAGGLRAVQTN